MALAITTLASHRLLTSRLRCAFILALGGPPLQELHARLAHVTIALSRPEDRFCLRSTFFNNNRR